MKIISLDLKKLWNDEEDCMQRLIDLQEKHGDLTWYSGYTDQDYAAGEYISRENFIYD